MIEAIEKESSFTSQVKIGGGEETAEDRVKKFDLLFPKMEDPSAAPPAHSLVIGACAPPQTRGTFKDGPAGKVDFKFTPPAERDLTVQGMRLELLADIGQWVTVTVKGKLSGGYVPPGQPAEQDIQVQLRAYL